jgi:steroid 5-alpha reductase family enzyme
LNWKDFTGWGIFMAGFIMEAVGDWQLAKHIADPNPNKGKFCKQGFWRYTRHPNYFGEAMIWWGLWLTTCSLPYGYWFVFSPLMITWLVRNVSGVAMLERKQRKHPEFAQYAKETNAFVPWFPKTAGTKSDGKEK